MRIALAQIRMFDDVEKNYQKSIEKIRKASDSGVDIVLFPELQFCKFFPQFPGLDVKYLAMEINDMKIKELQKLCKELAISIVPNFYLKEDGQYFDASIVIDSDGEIVGISKMVHIASAKYFYEKDYYTPSDAGFKVYETKKGKIGIVICFDRHYPESIRNCAVAGADIILIPTANTKAETLELFEWEMRVAAYQNNVFIAMCNRCGQEDEMDFSGGSIICNPDGNLVYKAEHKEELIVQDIDIQEVARARKIRPYISFLR